MFSIFKSSSEDEVAVTDPEELFSLGLAYVKGETVAQDYEQAAHLFRQAAEQGSVEAQYDLGIISVLQGMIWLCEAAEAGHEDAVHNVEALQPVVDRMKSFSN